MTINQIPISKFGAKLLAGYTVSGAAVSTTFQKPNRGNSFYIINQTLGMKTITLPFDIYGNTPPDVRRKLSALTALAAGGKVELCLPDGFMYTAAMQTISQPTAITSRIISCSYTFAGIQHDSKVILNVYNESFWVNGTLPQMDCILSATVGANSAKYSVAGVTFKNVKKGDRLILDGMTKRVLINGAPGAQKCDLVEFPYLSPGRNLISCPDDMTVEYFPAYL